MTYQPPQPPREYPGMPHHVPPDPNQPQATPKQRKTLRWILMGLGAAFVILIGLTVSTHPSAPSAPNGTTAGAAVPQLPVTTAPVATVAPTTTAAPAGPAATMTGDGQYTVGTDIVPGTYHTAGVAPGGISSCYWERQKDLTGGIDSIIANNIGTGPATVTIAKTDAAFKTHGCQAWTKVG